MKRVMAGIAGLLLAAAAEAQAPMDYAKPESWLCRPDANGACDGDLSLTEVTATGALVLPPPPTLPAKVDCFYVYPTVSRQPGGNSDGRATEDERYVAEQQFARFVDVCRRFAPLYRQTTLASIFGGAKGDAALAYGDVKAAWNHYLAEDNEGRGVILIGHSQGTRHLNQLIAEEIVGKPVQSRVVAAHVIGFPLAVADPEAATPGTPPPHLPLCRRANHTGCTVAYVTYWAERPPAADNRFAGRPGPGQMVACVNPARLMDTPTLAAILPTRPRATQTGIWASAGGSASLSPVPVATASYMLSGLIDGACLRGADGSSYLAASSSVPRIAATFEAMDKALPGWGLHLIDVNIAQGNLVALARRQAEAWVARQAAPR
jgi:hypothetical protein